LPNFAGENSLEEKQKQSLREQLKTVKWGSLLLTFGALIALSFLLAWGLNSLVDSLDIPLDEYAWLTYLLVFVMSILANATVIAPVPFAISIMVAAATNFNPVLVALFGALGGSLGEMSGYFAGRLGKKLAIPEGLVGYNRVEIWIQKYGAWAIAFLAAQPIVPFDVGGLIAGLARMPVHKFLPALFLGKFPKYIILIYAGIGLMDWLPFLKA
jgi:uncharacterized membrane protein YdjX (TVP38/TMEM64 family)